MNEVQVRQVSLTSSKSPERISGSWFSTGYYGHFRARPRIDVCSTFRQLARPKPPRTFSDRQTSAATSHLFSEHDNRRKYEADPLIRGAQTGIGKRRSQARVADKFDPFLIGWLPKNADRKTYIDETKTSTYADDYNRDSTLPVDIQPVNPTLSKSLTDIQPIDSSPSTEVSIYSTVYGHGQPDAAYSKQIRHERFQRFSDRELRRQQVKRIDQSTNVATCLTWNNNTDNKNQTIKTNDKLINIDLPIKLQSHLSSSVESTINQTNAYKSESMPTFKNLEQPPRFDPTVLREYYSFKVMPTLRRATSFIEPRTNTMESLVAKYM